VFTRSPARSPCEYAPPRKGTGPTGRRTPHRCRCEARRAADSRFAVKRNDVHGRAEPSSTTNRTWKRGHIPPNIRLRSEPMDGSRQLLWSWATIDSQLAISLRKATQVGARALMARWRLLGVLCRRRVHDKARAVAVHANRAPSTEVARHRVPRRYTARAAGCRRVHTPSWSFVAEATECHRSPPSAHTAASNALYSAWHRVALGPPSNTKCQPLY